MDLKIGNLIDYWKVIEGPFIIDGKEHYKLQCTLCGKKIIYSKRYITRKNFSKSCRSCSQKRRRGNIGRVFDIGTKVQNLTVVGNPIYYKGNAYYDVLCDCGHKFRTGHSTLSRKAKGGTLPFCNACFSQDKKSPKRNTMLTEHISKSRYGALRHQAFIRGIRFDVTPEYLEHIWNLQEGKCALSGIPLILGIKAKDLRTGEGNASLDRINSYEGYIEGNIQWVHKTINCMKNTLSQEDFIRFCNMVTTYTSISSQASSTPDEGSETT